MATRQPRTPRERAQAALEVEERRVKRLTAQSKRLRDELDAVELERGRAVTRRDYLKKHPDLQQPKTSTTTTTTTSTGGTT